MTLEQQLHAAFTRFADAHRKDVPRCRERELVSRFAFGPLLSVVTANAPLFSVQQIGIEVAVPQQPSTREKRRQPDVCKDLVLWSYPGQTTWGMGKRPHIAPMAVLEFKAFGGRVGRERLPDQRREELKHDSEWLQWFVGQHAAAEGYLVETTQQEDSVAVEVTRFFAGRDHALWFDSRERAHSPPHAHPSPE